MNSRLGVQQQKGVVLAISLIMLLLLTLIGITGMQVTSLEEKMASNYRDQSLAFQSAEAALLAGERQIETIRNLGAGSIQAFCDATDGLFHRDGVTGCVGCTNASCPMPDPKDINTWNDDTKSIKYDTGSTLVATQPRYYISFISNIPDVDSTKEPDYMFMITARGSGGNDNSQVTLRSYYGGKTRFQP